MKDEMRGIEQYFAEKYNCNLRTGWNTMALRGPDDRFPGTREEEEMLAAYSYLSRKARRERQ